MSFLPDFEDDIFISYAHVDNQPLTEGQKGWISNFHHSLEIRLGQLLGSDAKVWRDPALRGNDFFEDKLMGRIPKIAILVSVVSPRYINSEWCLREIKEFYKIAQETGGVRFEDRSRIFKVVKTPVPYEKLPVEIQGLLGYDFYQIEKHSGRARELNPEVDPSLRKSYWRKLDDLAYDIQQLLERLKHIEASPVAVLNSKPAVYLAETTFDLKDERESLRRELRQRGYTVFPDSSLPSNAADFEKTVRDYLRACSLSVHLIGENYGDIPKSETRSHVYLQNELAGERASDASFSRLIWMPLDLQARDERQQQFIDYLQNDSGAQQGAEVLKTTIEELKTVIDDRLTKKKEQPPPSLPGNPLRIYLVCDQSDLDAVLPIRDYLYDQGYEPILPAMGGGEIDIREDHKENLLLCGACLIYFGAANEFWLRSKLRDLQKIAGYGRAKPMLAQAVYVGGPETELKRDFRTHEAIVIKGFTTFTPESLRPFLEQIAQSEKAKGGRQ